MHFHTPRPNPGGSEFDGETKKLTDFQWSQLCNLYFLCSKIFKVSLINNTWHSVSTASHRICENLAASSKTSKIFPSLSQCIWQVVHPYSLVSTHTLRNRIMQQTEWEMQCFRSISLQREKKKKRIKKDKNKNVFPANQFSVSGCVAMSQFMQLAVRFAGCCDVIYATGVTFGISPGLFCTGFQWNRGHWKQLLQVMVFQQRFCKGDLLPWNTTVWGTWWGAWAGGSAEVYVLLWALHPSLGTSRKSC